MNLLLAQVSLNWTDGLIIYGPLGIGWAGMAYFINKLMGLHEVREQKMMERAREQEKLFRETMTEMSDAYKSMSHKVGSVAKAFVFVAATYGSESLKATAKEELARMGAENH